MSSKILIREPAWTGLSPSLPEWEPAERSDADFLCRVTGLSGRVFAMKFGAIVSLSMFRLETECSGPLLVKLIEPKRQETIRRAEQVASWLLAKGIQVASVLKCYPKLLSDGRLLVVMPFLAGRRVEATGPDLHDLGKAIAKLHQALAKNPDRKSWTRATLDRLSELQAIRTRVASGCESFGPDPAYLATLAADGTADFVMKSLPTRPLHGDFNPGNILIVGDSVTLLDFEDVLHSDLPPVFELVLVIERFVLIHCANDGLAVELGRTFLSGYTAVMGSTTGPLQTDPALVLRSLALRSLMTLSLGANSGITISDAEWGKFFDLEHQARSRAQTVRSIFSGFGT